jgi:hypothetical protein
MEMLMDLGHMKMELVGFETSFPNKFQAPGYFHLDTMLKLL